MISSAPTKFRSRYTGQEVDSLLTSITQKIDTSFIVNDFSGGSGLVASAEVAKTLYTNSLRLQDPNYIMSLILSIPNAVIVTQADLDKLNRLVGSFQGSYPNATSRNLAVNTAAFKGGELTFLVNDGNGQQELSYWDAGSLVWAKAKLTPSPNTTPIFYPSGGDAIVVTLDISRYDGAKYFVKVKSGSNILVFELLVCFSGSDTFWTTQGYIGNNTSIGKVVSASLTSTALQVTMNMASNSTVTFTKVVEV